MNLFMTFSVGIICSTDFGSVLTTKNVISRKFSNMDCNCSRRRKYSQYGWPFGKPQGIDTILKKAMEKGIVLAGGSAGSYVVRKWKLQTPDP